MNLKAIFLTHRHQDHIMWSTLNAILRIRPSLTVYTGSWLVPLLEENGIDKSRYRVIHPGNEYTIQGYGVMPFEVMHNVTNVGYYIASDKYDKVLFHATDLGSVEGLTAYGADIVALEFNHDITMMGELIQNDLLNYGFSHYEKSKHYHLSFQKARDFVDNKTKGEENIILFKLHTSGYFKKFLDVA